MARAQQKGLGGQCGPAGGPATALTPQMRVAELLAARPLAVMVFIRRGMACPGCDLNGFDTLAGAAQSYHVPVDELLAELEG